MLLNILKSMEDMLAKLFIILHKREFLSGWKIFLLNWIDVMLKSTFRATSLICCFTFCHNEFLELEFLELNSKEVRNARIL